jgi:queuine tRNA-ribosyltransferase subunit QTRTD1
MEANTAEKLSQIPEEMLVFTLESALQRSGPRVGRLALQNRAPISTPNFVSITSRGVVPHLSHDNIARHTNIRSLYFGLEDCKLLRPSNLALR